jgi:hypothetical protein
MMRDITLGLAVPAGGRPPEGTLIEVFTDKGVVGRLPWRAWGHLTLPSMQPGENRWVGITVPKLPAAGTALVTLTELKGARPVNGFSIGLKVSPIATVIGYLAGYHERVLKRLALGFNVAAAAAAVEEAAGEEVDFEERVRIDEDDLHIEVDVRFRGGRRRHRPHRHKPPVPTGADLAHYERWLRGQVQALADSLAALRVGDPFGIAVAITAVDSAAAGDLVALTTAHAGVLHRFDAMMTMMQKATGDRADIVQMVQWHRDLCERSAALSALPGTPAMRHHLQHFLDRVAGRNAQLADYGTLLAQLAPGLRQAGAALGVSPQLDPLIARLSTTSRARTLQKAHRELLHVDQFIEM